MTQMFHLDPSLPGLLGAVTHTKSDLCSSSSSSLDMRQQDRGREGSVMTTASLAHLPIITKLGRHSTQKGAQTAECLHSPGQVVHTSASCVDHHLLFYWQQPGCDPSCLPEP